MERLLIKIPVMNWAYTAMLDRTRHYTFGTSPDCTFPLPPSSAAPLHAVIRFDDEWLVEASSNENRTLINGVITSSHRLADGDMIKIGPCEATFYHSVQQDPNEESAFTRKVLERHRTSLSDFVSRARNAVLSVGSTEPTSSTGTQNPYQLTGKRLEQMHNQSAGDLVWVAQTLSTIMTKIMTEPSGKDETYGKMLFQLKDAISADTTFVMIPEQGKWVIRAWAGDATAWTSSEKAHPLPLTVANRAFTTRRVVSNALPSAQDEDEPIASASMGMLKVNSYIAVPILERSECAAVLYADTRARDRKFLPRDVKLLELAGSCITDIEQMKQ